MRIFPLNTDTPFGISVQTDGDWPSGVVRDELGNKYRKDIFGWVRVESPTP